MSAKTLISRALLATVVGPFAQAQDDTALPFHEEVTIVGKRESLRELNGAAHVIGPESLRRFAYSDIQRIARQVPGVSIQVEDGYGLRPNISIRGVASERSGRITLLEDNVLIAPAPYSAPSAYYFPTAGRMASVEVLKGPSAITQGPYTIGGALNMISTPIPEDWLGTLLAEGGEDETGRAHAFYGGTHRSGFGFLVETHQWFSDGYQSIDRSGRNTGLRLEDYTLKVGYAPPDSAHRLELKWQFAEQASNQSYLGLTDTDFRDNPWRRYGLSVRDRIDTKHEQVLLRYEFSLAEQARLTVTAYHNEHERNWFKTEGIDFDGSDTAESFSRTSWSRVVGAINRGEALGGLSADELQAVLHGERDTPAGSIQLRSNAREYFSRGLQATVGWDMRLAGASHNVEFGARIHEDEEDRLQRNSSYHQSAGELVLDDLGLLGNAGNRIQQAKALSVHIHDRIVLGRWLISPGLRFERIDQRRERFETREGRTADPSSRTNNLRDTRQNKTRVWLPGIGVGFDVHERLRLFGGVHKGFTAPTNAPDVKEEKAINYELGVRAHGVRWSGELTGFWSDYDNLLGICTASSGADCEVGDAFNGDAATVRGLEALLKVDLVQGRGYSVPLHISYTWMRAHFDSDVADTDFFGSVGKGDPIPYIPDHQLHASLGMERGPLEAYLGLHYVEAVCVRASCNEFERTDDALTVDLSVVWALTERVDLFGRVENLTGSKAILGRHPYGARPNKARTAALGVRIGL